MGDSSAALKPGGLLERAQKKESQQGICPTCARLVRISDDALGCAAHDKFILPDYLPYHSENLQCPDWQSKAPL